MIHFRNDSDFATVTKGLRREMKDFAKRGDLNAITYNQMLELLARAMGAPTQPALFHSSKKTAASVSKKASTATDRERYQLLNVGGDLDLVKAGAVFQGATLFRADSYLLNVPGLVSISAATRAADGKIEAEDFGSTDLNWSSQSCELDSHGAMTFVAADGITEMAGSTCFVAPEDFEASDLQSESCSAAWPIRYRLVQSYAAFLRDKRFVAAFLEYGSEDWFGDDEYNDTIPEMRAAEDAICFPLHRRELFALLEMLEAKNA